MIKRNNKKYHEPKKSSQSYKQRNVNYENPTTAFEHGARDMLYAVYTTCVIKPTKASTNIFSFYAMTKKHVLLNWIVDQMVDSDDSFMVEKLYSKFDIKDGRTSEVYMSSTDSDEFNQYVLGGRYVIDEIDKRIAMRYAQREVAESRQDALEDSDRHHNNTREALKQLQNKAYKAQSELEQFEQQMKEIENGK